MMLGDFSDLNEPNIQLNVTISSAKYTKHELVASSRPAKFQSLSFPVNTEKHNT